MHFARRVYLIAGLYGVVVLLPMYFTERMIGEQAPPPITHVEYYYGFVGAALSWQILYLFLSTDPVRYRPLMPVTILAKLSFGLATPILWALGRIDGSVVAISAPDLILAALFFAAYRKTPSTF